MNRGREELIFDYYECRTDPVPVKVSLKLPTQSKAHHRDSGTLSISKRLILKLGQRKSVRIVYLRSKGSEIYVN